MLTSENRSQILQELDSLHATGAHKLEMPLDSAQSSVVRLGDGRELINMCANDYLGLANHPLLLTAAAEALDRWGFGMASVRFICGTQQLHLALESRLSEFLGTEATILFPSCFDANAGTFEVLLDDGDAVISDELNHASIVDGIRLSRATRYRYAHGDLDQLEDALRRSAGHRRRLVVTDGVFSMDGHLAALDEICDLADRYDALVMVDDSHAIGVVGPTGRGTGELHRVVDGVDIVSGTFGKALGGGSGGFVSGRRVIVDLLRQRSRPYLFSNSIAPPMAAAGLKAIDIVDSSPRLRSRLERNAAFFRHELEARGVPVIPGRHPIVPVLIGDAVQAMTVASHLLTVGVLARSFGYPVVPVGAARIRLQVSAAHSVEQLATAVDKVAQVIEAIGLRTGGSSRQADGGR